MNDATEKAKRPTSITVICVLGLFGTLVTVPLIFSQLAQQIGSWYPPYLALSAVVGLVSMVGLWMMKRWGAYAYTGLAAINQVVLLAMGAWTVLALAIPAVVVFFALKHVSKMT